MLERRYSSGEASRNGVPSHLFITLNSRAFRSQIVISEGCFAERGNKRKGHTFLRAWPVLSWSILAGQVDDTVGEIKLDRVEWEIGVRDLFGKDHVAVAVVTGESSGVVGLNGQRPELERLVGYG